MTDEEIKNWIQNEADCRYPIGKLFGDVQNKPFIEGASAMYNLLSPQIQEKEKSYDNLYSDFKKLDEYNINLREENERYRTACADLESELYKKGNEVIEDAIKIESQQKEIERLNDVIRNRDECIWELEKRCGEYAEQLLKDNL